MRPPSKKEVEGYDIVIWVDKDGDIVTRGYTRAGHSALRGFVNEYHAGDIVQIYSTPAEFQADLPVTLAVGLLTPNGLRPMQSAHLH